MHKCQTWRYISYRRSVRHFYQSFTAVTVGWFVGRTCKTQSKRYTKPYNFFVKIFYSNYIILKCGRGPRVGHPCLTVTAELGMVRNNQSDIFTTENLLRVHPPASAYSVLNGSHRASDGINVEYIPGYLIALNLQNLISAPVIHLPYLCAEYLGKN